MVEPPEISIERTSGNQKELERVNHIIMEKKNEEDKTYDMRIGVYHPECVFVSLGETCNKYSSSYDNWRIWSIFIHDEYTDDVISFELPGGIKNGSTYEEIKRYYGEADSTTVYRSNELKYTTYHYEYKHRIYLDLMVWDDTGLQSITYRSYLTEPFEDERYTASDLLYESKYTTCKTVQCALDELSKLIK